MEAWGDEPWGGEPCEDCVALEDLQEAVRAIARAQVYEDGRMENGISVALVKAIMDAAALLPEEDTP